MSVEAVSLILANLREGYARELLHFFASAPFPLMLEIVRAKRRAFQLHGRQWRQGFPDSEVDIELACLMVACRDIHVATRSLKFKDGRSREEILEHDRQMADLRKEQAKVRSRRARKAPTLKAIQLRLPTILAMRNEGNSWRMIAKYLSKFAGLRVSHVYLREAVTMLAGKQSISSDNAV